MKSKSFQWIILFCSIAFSENRDYAFDIGVGLSKNEALFAPVPSLSFYCLKKTGIHEVSAEVYAYSRGSILDERGEYAKGFGITYSFLFKTPVHYFFIGPTVGNLPYWYTKINQISSYPPPWGTTVSEDYFGTYLAGATGALFIGENLFRIKLQERLMIGLLDKNRLGFLNTLTVSGMFAF